jgi:hypothetical protein
MAHMIKTKIKKTSFDDTQNQKADSMKTETFSHLIELPNSISGNDTSEYTLVR